MSVDMPGGSRKTEWRTRGVRGCVYILLRASLYRRRSPNVAVIGAIEKDFARPGLDPADAWPAPTTCMHLFQVLPSATKHPRPHRAGGKLGAPRQGPVLHKGLGRCGLVPRSVGGGLAG